MSYAIKKAGVQFYLKVDTNEDLLGKAANFSAEYIEDATGTSTAVTGPFTEPLDGLYLCPVTIPATGEYTVVIKNATDGMGNHPTPVVVVDATIDDVNDAITSLTTAVAAVQVEVDALDGVSLQAIKDNVEAVKLLLDDSDGSTVNSVMEFVAQIDAALADGGSGLAALSGYTDDIEFMLTGTEFLADGSTANPFYDVDNPGVAKESTLVTGLAALTASISGATDYTPRFDTLDAATAAVQAVVDANSNALTDAGFGLSALKDLIDGLSTSVGTHDTDIKAILNDATNGLAAIKTDILTELGLMDAKLDTIVNNTGATVSAVAYKAFI